MRHRDGRKKLDIDAPHRISLLRNLSACLIESGKIETTVAKAKYVRPYIERLITRAKKDTSFTSVKYLTNKLATKEAVKTLLSDIAPRFTNVAGGYTRIIRTRNRLGDNAEMARIEFTVTAAPKPAIKAFKKVKTAKTVATAKSKKIEVAPAGKA